MESMYLKYRIMDRVFVQVVPHLEYCLVLSCLEAHFLLISPSAPSLLSVTLINTTAKSNFGRIGFISSYCSLSQSSLRETKEATQAGTEAKAVEEYCILSYSLTMKEYCILCYSLIMKEFCILACSLTMKKYCILHIGFFPGSNSPSLLYNLSPPA